MAQQPVAQSYDFESQLELGEMLLNLGRIEDAAIELKKAKDLNEIGAYTTTDGDPQRQVDLRRLAQALSRVDDLQGGSKRASRVWSYLAAALLLGVTAIVFFVWALNRNELLEIRAQATAEAELIQVARNQEIASANQLVQEVTRISGQVADLYSENSQIQYAATSIAGAYEGAESVAGQAARIEDENRRLLETISAVVAEGSIGSGSAANAGAVTAGGTSDEESGSGAAVVVEETATPEPTEIPPTPLSDQELGNVIDQLRVDAWAANLRQGPGFAFFVLDSLRRGDVVTVLAKSEDTYWYNVVTEEGVNAWLHTSVAKPLSLDWLPPAATEPAPPFIPPTDVPTPVPPTPVPTPFPTAVPTAVPTAEPPPVEEEAVPVEEEAAPPAEGEEAPPAEGGEETLPSDGGEETPPEDNGDGG